MVRRYMLDLTLLFRVGYTLSLFSLHLFLSSLPSSSLFAVLNTFLHSSLPHSHLTFITLSSSSHIPHSHHTTRRASASNPPSCVSPLRCVAAFSNSHCAALSPPYLSSSLPLYLPSNRTPTTKDVVPLRCAVASPNCHCAVVPPSLLPTYLSHSQRTSTITARQ